MHGRTLSPPTRATAYPIIVVPVAQATPVGSTASRTWYAAGTVPMIAAAKSRKQAGKNRPGDPVQSLRVVAQGQILSIPGFATSRATRGHRLRAECRAG
jgi:hypothetical protein